MLGNEIDDQELFPETGVSSLVLEALKPSELFKGNIC